MRVSSAARVLLSSVLFLGSATPFLAEPAARALEAQQRIRVAGVVRDESNAITLPGLPVEVVGGETVYTDVDGRYVLELAPGTYQLKVAMDGYQEKVLTLEVTSAARNP